MRNSLLRLVYIDSKYIKFLYSFDNHVMYNKGQRRPYIGILFEVKGHKYYAPLTHPKEKFKIMKNDVDFMRIKGGELGAINFNNMIPVRNEAVIPINTKDIKDMKYKLLIINQLKFFDEHETNILDRATKLYYSYKKKTLRPAVMKRCCDFLNLEKVAKRYDPNFVFKKKSTEPIEWETFRVKLLSVKQNVSHFLFCLLKK